MKNLTELHNFPASVLEKVNTLYNDWINDKEHLKEWSPWHHCVEIPGKAQDQLRNDIPGPWDYLQLFKTFQTEDGRQNKVHIDRGRHCALQIPLTFDEGNFFSLAQKENVEDSLRYLDIPHSVKEGVEFKNPAPNGYFCHYDEKLFDHINCSVPWIQNTAVYHGGKQFGNKPRHFISVSYEDTTYEKVVEIFKEWM